MTSSRSKAKDIIEELKREYGIETSIEEFDEGLFPWCGSQKGSRLICKQSDSIKFKTTPSLCLTEGEDFLSFSEETPSCR